MEECHGGSEGLATLKEKMIRRRHEDGLNDRIRSSLSQIPICCHDIEEEAAVSPSSMSTSKLLSLFIGAEINVRYPDPKY